MNGNAPYENANRHESVNAADGSPRFQSRLQAKRDERRRQQRLQEHQEHQTIDAHVDSSRPQSTGRSHAHMTPTFESSSEETSARHARGGARRAVLQFEGTIWDAVARNNLNMVQNYFLVEGAATLVQRHSPISADGARTLLHCAAWYGHEAIVMFLLTSNAPVNAIDTVSLRVHIVCAGRLVSAEITVCGAGCR